MPFHEDYHLMLSAPETGSISEDIKSPLVSLEHHPDSTEPHANAVCKVPKWFYHKGSRVDHVTLEVPGINMKNVALFVSQRDLIVSAMRYVNNGGIRKVHCAYFFRMRLADDRDTNRVTSHYRNGVLSIFIPRMMKKVKKVVPAFVFNRGLDEDELMIELPGVNGRDIKYYVKDGIITVRASKYDDGRYDPNLEVEYLLTIRASRNSDLSEIHGSFTDGIFTLHIPRMPERFKEVVPVYFHEKKPDVDVVLIELPGVEEHDIEINVVGKQLQVRAKRFFEEGIERRMQTVYGFCMGFSSNNILSEVNSEFKDGILTMSIPRLADDRAERIISI